MDVRYIQMFCLDAVDSNSNLRGAWKVRSPGRAASRLYWGLSAFSSPVSKGEPWVMSEG